MENEPTTPPPNQTTETVEASPPAVNKSNDNTMGMLCHLLALCGIIGVPFGNILGPLVMWLVKREEIPFVDECGKEALNFQISMTIYGSSLLLLCLPMILVPFIGVLFVGVAMLGFFAIVIAGIVLVVIASIKASEGSNYQYPFTIRFIK